jgi:hypothetical protein
MMSGYEGITSAVALIDQVIAQLQEIGHDPEQISDIQAHRNKLNKTRIAFLSGHWGRPANVVDLLRMQAQDGPGGQGYPDDPPWPDSPPRY